MNIKDIFENFAVDFERTVSDDDWSRLVPYLADDATYINVGFQQERLRGREAVLKFLQEDIANSDRRYDSRCLAALTEPIVDGQHLSRRWRSTYTLQGVPDLVVEGEATDDDTLAQARVTEARGLATMISDDAENLYITVSSRALNPGMTIVARGSRGRIDPSPPQAPAPLPWSHRQGRREE